MLFAPVFGENNSLFYNYVCKGVNKVSAIANISEGMMTLNTWANGKPCCKAKWVE